MGKWYEKANATISKQVASLIEKYHPELVEAKVRVDVLLVHAPASDDEDKPKPPALMHHGYPAAAVVRKTSLKERTKGHGDAEIVLDGDKWPDYSTEEQDAILDHELEHLVVKRDDEGAIKADDRGRPMLKLKPHNWELGGFEVIIKRHGDAALEKQGCKLMADQYGQLLFPWG